jgi:hypothetical protein
MKPKAQDVSRAGPDKKLLSIKLATLDENGPDAFLLMKSHYHGKLSPRA